MKIKTIGKITSKSKKFDFSLEEQERHDVNDDEYWDEFFKDYDQLILEYEHAREP